MHQLSLIFRDADKSLDERFEDFHAAHADVYEIFARLSREMMAKGKKRYGAKALFERVRWELETSSSGKEPKINNSFVSRYVRLLVSREPAFEGFFETRILKSKEAS